MYICIDLRFDVQKDLHIKSAVFVFHHHPLLVFRLHTAILAQLRDDELQGSDSTIPLKMIGIIFFVCKIILEEIDFTVFHPPAKLLSQLFR